MFRNPKDCCLAALLIFVTGCSNYERPIESNDPRPATQTSPAPENSTSDNPTTVDPPTAAAPSESAVLKQDMIDVSVELMQAQDPNTTVDAVEGQVEQAIVEIRQHDPEFLVVSAETEQQLQAGTAIADSATRITVCEGFFSEFQFPLSGLVQSLIPQHQAGTLSPVRTELLAQLMVADQKKAEKALSN